MKKKVYIHQFQAASWKNLLPLSAALLASYAKSIPWISKEYDFEIDILRRAPSEVVRSYKHPDVLAFSTYSWNFRQSIEVARLGKICKPESLVVFGGPMIPNNPNHLREFFETFPFIDIVVHGMGEWPFSEILLARLGERDLEHIDGISYRNPEGSITTRKPLYNRNLDELPSPFLDGTFDEVLERYGDRITGALWETNRGCPYSCTFCVQGNPMFSKILAFSKDRLQKELEWMCKRKISYVFGTDANFGILPRDIEIAEMMASLAVEYDYPKFFIINWLKNSNERMIQIVETLQKGGVHTRLTLSMQSLNDDTLAAIKRRNLKYSTFGDMVGESAKRGIPTYTEIILGLPNDTYDSLCYTMEKCMDKHLNHFFVVYLCRLLVGTEMSEPEYRKRYQIETRTCRVGIARHEHFDDGVAEDEDIVVATSTLPIHDWKRIFTLIFTTLVLYNFRLAFFIFNYLKEEYSIDLINLIDYLIKQATEMEHSTIGKALKVINNIRQSILDGETNLVSLDFTGNMLFEAHEAALLILVSEKDNLYRELWELINNYLKLKGIKVDPSVLAEVFLYQQARIPTWQKTNSPHVQFKFNIPQYFHSLCVNDKSIPISYQKTLVEMVDGKDMDTTVDFAKSRLTISTFEISEIKHIGVTED